MIERWLQFTCDRCEETGNSPIPNMTVAEFRKEEKLHRHGGKDLCHRCWLAVTQDGASPGSQH